MKILRILLLAACAAGIAQASPAADGKPAERRAQLRAVAIGCGVDPSTLQLDDAELVHVRAQAHARYRQLHCVFTALGKAGFRTQMGFVGNETYDTKAR